MKKPLCFVDVETTGLNSALHEIIEISIIKVCPQKGMTIYTTKIQPENIQHASPKALEINGYNHRDWERAPAAEDVVFYISELLSGSILVGHNVRFDEEFISELLHLYGSKQRYSRRTIDTITLAHEHLPRLHSLSMDSIRGYFFWDKSNAHTAYVDAMDCMRLYYKLLRANSFKRTYWRMRNRVLSIFRR